MGWRGGGGRPARDGPSCWSGLCRSSRPRRGQVPLHPTAGVGELFLVPWKPLSQVLAGWGALNRQGALGVGLPRALSASSNPPPSPMPRPWRWQCPATLAGDQEGPDCSSCSGWGRQQPCSRRPTTFTPRALPGDAGMAPPQTVQVALSSGERSSTKAVVPIVERAERLSCRSPEPQEERTAPARHACLHVSPRGCS